MNKKIVSSDEIKLLAHGYRADKKRIVFTNGCFDILHAGHVSYLTRAARSEERRVGKEC